jgi:hypothetical protein
LRAKSTVFTGGVGNLVVATAGLGGSLLVSLLAPAPIITLLAWRKFLWFAIRLIRRSPARSSGETEER